MWSCCNNNLFTLFHNSGVFGNLLIYLVVNTSFKEVIFYLLCDCVWLTWGFAFLRSIHFLFFCNILTNNLSENEWRRAWNWCRIWGRRIRKGWRVSSNSHCRISFEIVTFYIFLEKAVNIDSWHACSHTICIMLCT